MKLIKRIIAWLNEPQPTLGCPDPELHDRNNEARHGDVIAAALLRPDFDCNYIIPRSGYDDLADLGQCKMIGYVVIPIEDYEKLAPLELREGVREKLAELLAERKQNSGPVWYPKNSIKPDSVGG